MQLTCKLIVLEQVLAGDFMPVGTAWVTPALTLKRVAA